MNPRRVNPRLLEQGLPIEILITIRPFLLDVSLTHKLGVTRKENSKQKRPWRLAQEVVHRSEYGI